MEAAAWGVSEYLHESHNLTVLLYHLVLPAQYGCVVSAEAVDTGLKFEQCTFHHPKDFKANTVAETPLKPRIASLFCLLECQGTSVWRRIDIA